MATRKVPSQAASGAETFSDNLVGRQITNGSASLANTTFDIDKVIPEKDAKTFKTVPFSEFLTLDSLNKQNGQTQTSATTQTGGDKKGKIRFKGAKKNADKSLFGSLKERILVSIQRIIKGFPAGLHVNSNSPIGSNAASAINVTYDNNLKRTTFFVEVSK